MNLHYCKKMQVQQILHIMNQEEDETSYSQNSHLQCKNMEAMQILHMNKGEGETSYAKNSNVQKQIIEVASSTLAEAVADSVRRTAPESMGIADLGCSSGPNSLIVISMIIDTVMNMSSTKTVPDEIRVSLNDLPGNDFNSIFASLPEFYQKLKKEKSGKIKIVDVEKYCFVSAVAGSFHGRLFPKKSLHFVHSSSSLHWLSQVPPGLEKDNGKHVNKGNIYISKTSPACVVRAYLLQFQSDFVDFLRSRADEVVGGGGMLLSFMGRRSPEASDEECCKPWELLAQALISMAAQGLVEEVTIDSVNAPYYAPSVEEVKNVVQAEGSFLINHLEALEIDWDGGSKNAFDECDLGLEKLSGGERVAKNIRAVVETMLESHFGTEIMDELFVRYGKLVDDYLSRSRGKLINLVISLTRKA